MNWPFVPRLFTSVKKFACIGVIRGCPYFQLGLDRLVGFRSKTSLTVAFQGAAISSPPNPKEGRLASFARLRRAKGRRPPVLISQLPLSERHEDRPRSFCI